MDGQSIDPDRALDAVDAYIAYLEANEHLRFELRLTFEPEQLQIEAILPTGSKPDVRLCKELYGAIRQLLNQQLPNAGYGFAGVAGSNEKSPDYPRDILVHEFETAEYLTNCGLTKAASNEQFLCEDCGVNSSRFNEVHVVHNSVWKTAGNPAGMLCIGCLEERLGRILNVGDFADVPDNSGLAENARQCIREIWTK